MLLSRFQECLSMSRICPKMEVGEVLWRVQALYLKLKIFDECSNQHLKMNLVKSQITTDLLLFFVCWVFLWLKFLFGFVVFNLCTDFFCSVVDTNWYITLTRPTRKNLIYAFFCQIKFYVSPNQFHKKTIFFFFCNFILFLGIICFLFLNEID